MTEDRAAQVAQLRAEIATLQKVVADLAALTDAQQSMRAIFRSYSAQETTFSNDSGTLTRQ